MKRIIKSIVIISLLLLTSCRRVTEQQAREALHNNLIKRYGEEFEIGYMGRRSDGKEIWYEAEIYPSKYKGTPKEYDKYYRSTGSVDIRKGIFGEKIDYTGDLYREVLINESASKFYLTKLKELFGENVLPVFNIDVSKLAINPDYYETLKNRLAEGRSLKLKGGIYIFGRVENDEDREWYRKQIYEFVQFMKQTGTFEYVDLGITVIDERELVNLDNPHKYIENLSNDLDKETWRKERRRLMKNGDEEFVKLSKDELKNRINSLNKGSYDDSGFINLLFTRIYSPKYIKSKGWNESNRKELYEEIKEYNSIEDITFKMEWW
ncbi:hypothetical protein [Fusobacterium sp. SYSU M8D902]|uniref:hypothetical protein n=1 Tax=Fusobacterium sp. SYSU M8D902 TaxID=3159562 RepID=UPI0032E49743